MKRNRDGRHGLVITSIVTLQLASELTSGSGYAQGFAYCILPAVHEYDEGAKVCDENYADCSRLFFDSVCKPVFIGCNVANDAVFLAARAGCNVGAPPPPPPPGGGRDPRVSARLKGSEEVPPIDTAGTGDFKMRWFPQGTVTFSLSFSHLSSPLSVAHLHFAPSKVAGGVMIFLCGGGGQPACPATTEGIITGTITAANVTGPTTQGIAPGDLDSALEAVRKGLSYVNMHTANFGSGEIRGQVKLETQN